MQMHYLSKSLSMAHTRKKALKFPHNFIKKTFPPNPSKNFCIDTQNSLKINSTFLTSSPRKLFIFSSKNNFKEFNCRFLIDSNGSIFVKSQISVQMVGNFSLDLRTYVFVETGEKFRIVAPWWTKQ
jgi:hypothetical protein